MGTALLFDRDRVEELEGWENLPELTSSSILWVDVESPSAEQIEALASELELSPESAERLAHPGDSPNLTDFGSCLLVTAFAPSTPRSRELRRVGCLVSEQWIVTVHDAPLEVLDTFRERATGSGATGELDGVEFLADLLEWVLHAYLAAFEDIERALEDIDALTMAGELDDQDDLLEQLVAHRREIGRLRRALTAHRELVLALTRPELDAISSSRSVERFAALRDRLEEAVQSARDSRDAVVGSFDLVIASTGQRTNEIVKVMTLASVLLLPAIVVAGILGMNFEIGFFDDPTNFWLALALMAGLAAVTLVAARVRRWV